MGPLSTKFIVWLLATILYLTSLSLLRPRKNRSHNGIFFLLFFSAMPQLRYLQTLSSIAAEHNSTIIFPMPMNILDHFIGGKKSPTAELDMTPAGHATAAAITAAE